MYVVHEHTSRDVAANNFPPTNSTFIVSTPKFSVWSSRSYSLVPRVNGDGDGRSITVNPWTDWLEIWHDWLPLGSVTRPRTQKLVDLTFYWVFVLTGISCYWWNCHRACFLSFSFTNSRTFFNILEYHGLTLNALKNVFWTWWQLVFYGIIFLDW